MALNDQTQAALDNYAALKDKLVSQLTTFQERYNTLTSDLSAPNAVADLEQLLADRVAFRDEVTQEINDANAQKSAAIQAIDDPAAKSEATAALNAAVNDIQSNVIVPLNELKANIQTSIADAKNAATKEGEPSPENTKTENESNDETTANSDGDSAQAKASGTTTEIPEVTVTASRLPKEKTISAKPNPLSAFSSYAYGVSLYMVTPEAVTTFVNNGGVVPKGRDNGFYVVAQSGGINTDVEDRLITISRTLGPGKEGLDYYIDNLKLTTLLPGPNKQVIGTEIKFDIIEPTGFSFMTDLARAAQALNGKSEILKLLPEGVAPNGLKQHFIIGIKFFGYDVNGNPVTAGSPEVQGYSNSGNSVIQRFFSIKMTNMKFKLNGKVTTYHLEAVVISEHTALSQVNATLKNNISFSAATIGEALNGSTKSIGLSKIINNDASALKDRNMIEAPMEIAFEFLDEDGKVVKGGEIESAKLVDDASFNKNAVPGTGAKTSDKVNIADSFKATSFDTRRSMITLVAGQNIQTIVDNLITKSTYITDAMTAISKSDPEAESSVHKPTKKLTWYVINPVVEVKNFDNKTSDWVYKITYQIRPFMVPYVRTDLAGLTSKYPGPYKRYNYLLTGQNSEVLEYNQNYDGLYYSIHSISTSAEKEGTRKQNSSQAPTQPVNTSGDSDPSGGGQNDGSKLADSVRSMLYSPADLTIGKIKIIGDPDFLMTSPGVKNKAAVAKVYGSSSDGSVDPLVGQTFVEMKFNMASDYAPNGLLDVSDQLQFYKSNRPKSAGIEGIVYQVYKVESSFSRGSFTQWLEAFMPLEDSLVTGTENNTPAEQRKESGDYAAKSGSSSAAAASNEMLSNPADQDGARRETSNTETTKITTEVRKENNSTEQSTTTSNESKPVDTAVAKEEQSPNDETYTGASSYYGEDYDNSGREDTKEA